MKYNVTLKIRKANCDSRSGLAAEKQIRKTGILPQICRRCSRGFGMPNVSVHWFWGAHGSSPVWPSVKLAVKHDCWSVPQVSRPTLHRRVYTWSFPITRGFSSLLQGPAQGQRILHLEWVTVQLRITFQKFCQLKKNRTFCFNLICQGLSLKRKCRSS